jgi:DNA-binding transcriptional MerR regulator
MGAGYDQVMIESNRGLLRRLRLYCILALRDIGLSLTEIGHILDNNEVMLGSVLRSHLERVNAELERLGRLRGLLEHACAHEAQQTDPNVLATIEAMSRVSRHAEVRISTNTHEDTEAQWRTLGTNLRACLDAGESAASPHVQKIALEAKALLLKFTAGDHAMLDALAHLRKFAPPDNLAGWDPPLFRFLDQARLPPID